MRGASLAATSGCGILAAALVSMRCRAIIATRHRVYQDQPSLLDRQPSTTRPGAREQTTRPLAAMRCERCRKRRTVPVPSGHQPTGRRRGRSGALSLTTPSIYTAYQLSIYPSASRRRLETVARRRVRAGQTLSQPPQTELGKLTYSYETGLPGDSAHMLRGCRASGGARRPRYRFLECAAHSRHLRAEGLQRVDRQDRLRTA